MVKHQKKMPTTVGNKTRRPIITASIQHYLEGKKIQYK